MDNNKTVVNVLRNKRIPEPVIQYIMDLSGVVHTIYNMSEYYKNKVKNAISWVEWRERNNIRLMYPCTYEINRNRYFGKIEIEKEKISKLIYGI